MAFALTGARVFDGESIREGLAVVIDGPHCSKSGRRKRSPQIRPAPLARRLLAPGFIDVQVNGGGGALLNDNPTIDTVRRIAESHRKFGTTGMLPTVITDAPEVLSKAIASVKAARAENVPGVLGIHIEGPFLDKERKGAHEAKFIRAMTRGRCGTHCHSRLRQRHADACAQSRSAGPDQGACRARACSSALAIPKQALRKFNGLGFRSAGLHPSLQCHEPDEWPRTRHGRCRAFRPRQLLRIDCRWLPCS